jgi:hypothetical protein
MNPQPPPPVKISVALPPPSSGRNNMTFGKASKLKRSPQMGNLYRLLRNELEGNGSVNKKSAARKSHNNTTGNTSNGAGGIAAAFADMAKRYIFSLLWFQVVLVSTVLFGILLNLWELMEPCLKH